MPKGKSHNGVIRPGIWAAGVCLALIRVYQVFISPLTPPVCRFYPSCSQYFYEAVKRYGLVKGGAMGLKRVLHCHPFHPGGYDPVR